MTHSKSCPSRSRRDGLGNLFVLGVALAVGLAILGSGFNLFVGGSVCTDRARLRESDQFVVCEVEFAQRNKYPVVTAVNKSSVSFREITSGFLLVLPILFVLAGASISLIRARPRAFGFSFILAVLVLALPWFALAVLAP
jgi:hypothetical protein